MNRFLFHASLMLASLGTSVVAAQWTPLQLALMQQEAVSVFTAKNEGGFLAYPDIQAEKVLQLDQDNDGKLTFKEFMSPYQNIVVIRSTDNSAPPDSTYLTQLMLVEQAMVRQRAVDMFMRYDWNRDRILTYPEIQTDQILQLDQDNDGKLTFTEFMSPYSNTITIRANGNPDPTASISVAAQDRARALQSAVSAFCAFDKNPRNGLLACPEVPMETIVQFDQNNDLVLSESEYISPYSKIVAVDTTEDSAPEATSEAEDDQAIGATNRRLSMQLREVTSTFTIRNRNDDSALIGNEIPTGIVEYMALLDLDGNGELAIDEMLRPFNQDGASEQPTVDEETDRKMRIALIRPSTVKRFQLHDMDSNGSLVGSELPQCYCRHRRVIDKDANGGVELNELLKYVARRPKAPLP